MAPGAAGVDGGSGVAGRTTSAATGPGLGEVVEFARDVIAGSAIGGVFSSASTGFSAGRGEGATLASGSVGVSGEFWAFSPSAGSRSHASGLSSFWDISLGVKIISSQYHYKMDIIKIEHGSKDI
jgi:hypothetical protein